LGLAIGPFAILSLVLHGDTHNELARLRSNGTITCFAVGALLTAWGPWSPVTFAILRATLLVAALNLLVAVLPLDLLIANILDTLRTTARGWLGDFKTSRPGAIATRDAAITPLSPFTLAWNFAATITARNCVLISIVFAALLATKLRLLCDLVDPRL